MPDERRNWFEAHPRRAKLIVFILSFLLLELLTRGLVWTGLLHYERHPTGREPQYWAYNDPVVGIWHLPDTAFLQRERCCSALHTTNSIGARDRERSLVSSADRRVVVLGDSFVEGWCVDQNLRATDILEARTGVEHLNLGTSGSFGTIQEWLLYRDKATRFDHTDIVLLILPDNDFADNDPDNFPGDQYRPYLREIEDGYEVYYPVAFEERSTETRRLSETVKNTIDNNVYLLNALRWGIRVVKGNQPIAFDPEPRYDSYDAEDLDRMLYALRQIVTDMGERRLWLFTIPRGSDFEHARLYGPDYRLVNELETFAAAHDGVEYNDLLPHFLEHAEQNDLDFQAYTLGCNDHWGEVGNRVGADAIHAVVFGQDIEEPLD